MQVKVLQHHIDEGTPKRAGKCAIALALREAIPAAESIFVGVMIRLNHLDVTMTPYAAMKFIDRFDAGEDVEPFTFELDYTPREK